MQEIEEQLCKLDSDKCVVEVCWVFFFFLQNWLCVKVGGWNTERNVSGSCLSLQDRVCELKEEVRLQYQRMHELLEEDLGRTLEALDRAQARFCQENMGQVLALGEQRHEAQKLLSSIHTAFGKAEELSFMKNTKPVKILTDRCSRGFFFSQKCKSIMFFFFSQLLILVSLGLRRVWAATSPHIKSGISTPNSSCRKSPSGRKA